MNVLLCPPYFTPDMFILFYPSKYLLERKLNTFTRNTFFPKGKNGDVKVDDISAKTMKLLLIFIYKDILAKGGLILECFSFWLKSPKQGAKSLS